jgi:hypothetical protein
MLKGKKNTAVEVFLLKMCFKGGCVRRPFVCSHPRDLVFGVRGLFHEFVFHTVDDKRVHTLRIGFCIPQSPSYFINK